MDFNEKTQAIERMIARIEDLDTGFAEAEKLVQQARKSLDECYAFLKNTTE